MSVIERYYERIDAILREAFSAESEAMEAAAALLAETNEKHRSIFAFGCNHAGLLALELFYRSGGMVTVNAIRAPGMMLEVSPITMSSEMERMEGYGRILLNGEPCKAGDVIIIHSVSGRNAVTVDMAMAAREKGMKVIVLTNMKTATATTSRHSSGKMLYELADATCALEGFAQKVSASSTAVGAAILNAIAARASEILLEKGIEPPVFMSGNLEGGDAYNKAVIEKHKENIFYM